MRACSTQTGARIRQGRRQRAQTFAPNVCIFRIYNTRRYEAIDIETESKSSNDQPQSYNVLQCNQGSHYCCREVDDTKNCCDGPNTFSANIGKLLLPTKTISVSGTGTAAVTTTPTSDSSSQKDTSDSKCPKNNTAVVGGAVGGVLGVALLAALGTIAALTLRKPKNTGRYFHRLKSLKVCSLSFRTYKRCG